MYKMRVFSLAVFVFMVACATMKAQTRFTEQLESKVTGQGVIYIEQDHRLTEIVNGDITIPSSIVSTSKVNSLVTESKVKQEADEIKGKASGLHQKVRGYRVQVYFGGNQRSDQTQAQSIGNKVSNMFPELRAYISFESPHWRCRLGDFVKYEDASAYMHRIKAKGISSAMVVKSEIYVSLEQLK